MRSQLADFLDRGVLPFTGRSNVVARIVEFWRAASEAQHLQGLLLTGEAGIGKSRIVEEVATRLAAEGGAIVHAKLYPESTITIAPSVARALRYMDLHRQVIGTDLDETLSSISTALRRLAGRRPTLLVMEDIHLLTEDSLRECVPLLSSIEEEPISLLCTARPLAASTYTTLQRFLPQEIELSGLQESDIDTLLSDLLGTQLDEATTRMIHHATLGAPLALRSALRGLLKSNALARDPISNTWKPTVSRQMFNTSLKRSVELLSEGMAAHLSEEEKTAAAQLATLGEVFAAEAARILVDDPMIKPLTFKGILVATTAPTEHHGRQEAFAFTHTLLHRRLVEQNRVDVDRLLRTIGSEAPIYSLAPFHILAERAAETNGSAAELREAINRSLDAAQKICDTTDWHKAPSVWETASKLFETHKGQWSGEESLRIRLDIHKYKIALLVRSEFAEEYGRLVEQYLAMTEEPATIAIADHRLVALSYRFIYGFRTTGTFTEWARDEINTLTEQFPALFFTREYIFYLEQLARYAVFAIDKRLLRSVEQRMVLILSADEFPQELKELSRRRLYRYLLMNFDTVEQLQQRKAWFEQMQNASPSPDSPLFQAIGFLANVGDFDQMLMMLEETQMHLLAHGRHGHVLQLRLQELFAHIAFGLPLDHAEARARAIIESELLHAGSSTPNLIGLYLLEAGILTGAPAWACRMANTYIEHPARSPLMLLALQSLHQGTLEQIRPALFQREDDEDLSRLIETALGGERSDPTAARRLLRRDMLRMDDFTMLYATLGLIELIDGNRDRPEIVTHEEIANAVDRAITWFADRKLPAFMTALMASHAHFIPSDKLAKWRATADQAVRERRIIWEKEDQSAPPVIRLSMLGSVRAQLPDGTQIPMRGSRLRALLGLMVADRMTSERLRYDMFSTIITGIDDPDRARRSLNSIVFRLRELLGHDVVLTDGPTPVLNLNFVTVDLLEIHALLKTAAKPQSITPAGAQKALVKALGMLRGEAPFPALYDRFFEEAREAFENLLRTLILKTANALIAEHDFKAAEDLLQRAFRLMSGDEDITELLCSTLVHLGKRAEAERVRMQATDVL